MATMRSVAELAGVSLSTVAAVVNENKYVSPDLKKKVRDAIDELDYRKHTQVNNDADSSVAVILPGIDSSFFPSLLHAIGDVAEKRGLIVTLYDSERNIRKEEKMLRLAVEKGVRGIILDSVCDENHENDYFNMLQKDFIIKQGIHIVIIERRIDKEGFTSVYTDNFEASYKAVTHLIDNGCKQLAHLGGASVFPHTRIREEAFFQALADHDIPTDSALLLRGDFTPISGYSLIQEALDKGFRFDGLFAANDQMAIGAMKAILGAGLRIPEDIEVVGFDNLPISSIVSPGLSTVQIPIYQMGYHAARVLADKRDGLETDVKLKLDSRFIVRRSTNRNAESDWSLYGW